MSPENHDSSQAQSKPRVGIPWRTRDEERQHNVEKLNYYFEAVRRAGGVPEHVSLGLSNEELQRQARQLDAFVLPGSPADVDPARYAEPRHDKTKTLDADRDRTDSTILDHAIAVHKPVLAICYGCQILNVHQGGTLVQDIPAEKPGTDAHGKTDLAASAATKDLEHGATLAEGSQLKKLAGAAQVQINSSHHQSIDRAGEKLLVTARHRRDYRGCGTAIARRLGGWSAMASGTDAGRCICAEVVRGVRQCGAQGAFANSRAALTSGKGFVTS